MSGLNEIKQVVEKEQKVFNDYFKKSIKSDIPLLNIIMNYILKTKGKQIRPLFVFLTAKLSGECSQSTYVAATLIELLHTATLIHDDVIDEANYRRGFFSISALWKSKVAVLAGDYLLSRGLLIAMKNKEYALLEIVTQAVKEMSEGELSQLQKSRKLDITESEYFEIIKKKTATLFKACCACGIKSIDASDFEIKQLSNFGEIIGMAFQIKDDLLDYTRQSITGKQSGNDIKEKKITLPLIHSLKSASKSQRKKIISLLGKNKKNRNHISTIIDFVKENNGIEYAENKMMEFKNEALTYLAQFENNDAKTAIINLCEYIINRKK